MATKQTFTYPSSIDPAINNLYARVHYGDNTYGPLPILVYMHGYSSEADTYPDSQLDVLADQGLCVVAFSMRGSDGAAGSRGCNGIDPYDIYDGLKFIRENFPLIAHPYIAYINGMSEGGGTAYALIGRFPDLFAAYVAHFPISDYGHDPINGWYYTNTSFRAGMAARIGGTPTEVPDNYYMRSLKLGVVSQLAKGAYLYFFHGSTDTTVSVEHSRSLRDLLDVANITNYTYVENTVPHGTVTGGTEPQWMPQLVNNEHLPWVFPASGEDVLVQGWLFTKRFRIFMGTGEDVVANLDYNCNTGLFTLELLTSLPVSVTIYFNGQSLTQTLTTTTNFQFIVPPRLQMATDSSFDNDYHRGALGEITTEVDTGAIRVHDGQTVGGKKISPDPKITIITSNTVLDKRYSNIIITQNADLTLLNPLLMKDHIHHVVNHGVTVNITTYKDLTGSDATTIPSGAATLQSDGINWYRIK